MSISMLTSDDAQFFRTNYKSMLRQSKIEFNDWKKTRNIVFLQQSCEKVFNALEQYVQLKSKQRFESHSDFRELYRKLGLSINILHSADDLHKFFYNGQAFEKDLGIVEDTYMKVYNYIINR